VVYLHRVSNATKYLALVREYFPKARVLYSVADLHHVRLARQGSLEGRPELLAQSRQQRLAECTAAWAADAVLTHSAVEVELLRQAVPDANVHLVPWAVPLRPTKQPLAKRFGLAFIGAYAHPPNVDAAHFLAEAIMPRVWQRDPSIECLLVGSQMPQDIKRLARPGLIPIGQVQDLAEVFERVRLTVAPLRYGAGVKGKVLESLAAGVPCVMSEMAAEGLVLPAALQRLVARDEAALAQLICQLHADATANSSAAAAGLALMQQAFTSEAIASALKRAISTKCPAAASPAGGALRPAGG
jgi:glycosyltransferase involved in cell wall biosynthesis